MSEPTTPNEREALVNDIKAAIAELAQGASYPDLLDAIDHLAAQRTDPAAPVASTAAVPEGAEPVAWEAPEGLGIKRFVSDRIYRMYSPKVQTFYKPFRCSTCAHPSRESGDVEAMRAALVGLVQIWNKKADGRAGSPNHGHAIPGVWDSDNGELAGKPCAECALYDMARAAVDAARTAEGEANG